MSTQDSSEKKIKRGGKLVVESEQDLNKGRGCCWEREARKKEELGWKKEDEEETKQSVKRLPPRKFYV